MLLLFLILVKQDTKKMPDTGVSDILSGKYKEFIFLFFFFRINLHD